jgi:MOSC domain-containing protein
MATMATVAGLFVYPVKSARGIALERAHLAATGFRWDRHWMLIDPKGTFLSQRTHPQLARIVPEITAQGLTLRAPGQPELRVPFAADGARVVVRVHRDPCIGLAQGRAADEWLSRAVGEAVQLVRVPAHPERQANPAFAGPAPVPMGFADGFPVLVCNEASLEDLNARMPQSIPMERFRPNVVLRGLPAWAEDRIDTLTVGKLTLRLVKPCTRCTIPSVDQHTGLRGADPAPVLRSFRFDRELLGVTFGENAVIAAGEGCEITVGEPCGVTFDAHPRGC